MHSPSISISPEKFNPVLVERLRKLLLMLSSPHHPEKLAAALALDRALEAAGLTHHDLADRLLPAPPAKPGRGRPRGPETKCDFSEQSTYISALLNAVNSMPLQDIIFVRACDRLLDEGRQLTGRDVERLFKLYMKHVDGEI